MVVEIKEVISLEIAKPSQIRVFLHFVSNLVTEHYLMFIMFAYMCHSTTTQNLIQDKCCLVELAYSEKICNDLHNKNNTQFENAVQSMATNYNTASIILATGPAIITTVLLGSWSDIYGRKIPLIIATVGLILEVIALSLNVLAFNASIGFMLVPAIISGISGGLMVAILCTLSYLADVTESKTRPIRLAFLELSVVFAGPVGSTVGGIIYKEYSYLPVFGMAIIFNIIALVYICIRLKEPDKKKLKNCKKEALKCLFSFENIKSNFRTCTRRREGTIRAEIWLLFASMFSLIFCTMGPPAFSFFFVQKMYGWDNFHYSLVNLVFSISTAIVILIAIPVMTRVLKLHDASISIIGTICMALGAAIRGLSYKQWGYYLSSLVAILSGISGIGIRSRLSKLVSKDEIGKVFSILSLCESVTPLIGMTLFGTIYSNSVTFFPGLSYMIVAAILVIPLIILFWIYKWGTKLTTENTNSSEMEITSTQSIN